MYKIATDKQQDKQGTNKDKTNGQTRQKIRQPDKQPDNIGQIYKYSSSKIQIQITES